MKGGKQMVSSVIVSAARTAIGKFGGQFRNVPAVDLGAAVLRENVRRAIVDSGQVDQVVMGMVLQGGAGQIPSRQAARKAGYPWQIQSETINKVCASGLRAVSMADQMIRSGDAHVIAAGGMESMSQAPYVLRNARWGMRMGEKKLEDLMVYDGLTCSFDQVHMAVHGNRVAKEYVISRQEQDEWALRSQERAVQAMQSGRFAAEIVSVQVQNKKGETTDVDLDEAPRPGTSMEKLAQLPPLFIPDGSVTAGNAPGVNDGAAAVLLMSEARARAENKRPLARIIAHAAVADEAAYFVRTPALAVQKLLHKTGYGIGEIDLFEINEAFAAVVLTSTKIAGWDPEKVNVNGGAVALGHPIGASGARILVTLIHELHRRGGGLGIAAICSGAGQGDAMLIHVDG
jgi:acetyl-CoA C-acetyltransferase